jgi:membrane protein YdbS with pleckstrin-like domain
MKIKEFVLLFLISFVLALLVNVAITVMWNYFIKHNEPVIDWGPSFTIALILAIVISLSQIKKPK